MKILLNRKPVSGPWGGGNLFLKAFIDEANKRKHRITHTLEKGIDLLFMQDPRYDELGISANEIIAYKMQFKNVKLVHRVNECDARKGMKDIDHILRGCSEYSDLTIFVSNWMKDYHVDRGWACTNNTVFINGVSKEDFCPGEKIKNGKTNIITHHWSDNFLKGFDIYEQLDEWIGKNEQFTFTYIGRERGTFKNTMIIAPLFGALLGKELRKYDVYVSGSRFDPGPNHILESLACKIPTYVHCDGGGAAEFAGDDHCFKNIEEFLEMITSRPLTQNELVPADWKEQMPILFNKLERLISK